MISVGSANFFLTVLPHAALWILFIAAVLLYFFPAAFTRFKITSRNAGYQLLAVCTIVFRIFYAALLTLGQYAVWSGDTFSRFLLNSPLGKSVPLSFVRHIPWIWNTRVGYFLFYSWGHFWLNALLSILAAAAFWQILVFLKKRRERFFDEGEVELGFLAALLAGWPSVILFVIFAFVIVIIFSIFRGIFLKEPYTTLGVPFLLAVLLTFLGNGFLLSLFKLSVLAV